MFSHEVHHVYDAHGFLQTWVNAVQREFLLLQAF
jgi:hypothetical protein